MLMIKLTEEDKLSHKDHDAVLIKMHCMICTVFPEVVIQLENTAIWEQSPNPVPSNRVCLHLKHRLECPHCEFGVVDEEAIRERYHIDQDFREKILKRDNYTCQA